MDMCPLLIHSCRIYSVSFPRDCAERDVKSDRVVDYSHVAKPTERAEGHWMRPQRRLGGQLTACVGDIVATLSPDGKAYVLPTS